jgi:amino acid adenylation domain-containing protein
LPLARNPATVAAPHFERLHARLDREQWQTIKARARRDDLTTTTVLATAFAEVLCLWTGQTALTLNFTLFDRQAVHADVDKIVGEFTSLLLVPYRRDPGSQWSAAVRSMQEQVALGLDNRSVSGLSLLRELARQAGQTTAAMPVVFTSMLGVADELVKLSLPFGDYAGGLSQTPQIWLDNQVIEHDGELLVNWDFVAALFPAGMIEPMFEAFIDLLRMLAAAEADWQRPVALALPASQQQVRQCLNATAQDVARQLLHEGFFARAAEHPRRPALLWGNDSALQYGELAERVLRVAAMLGARGIRPGDTVAVSLPKGPDQVIGVLGILAAGAVYAPIGIDQPAARQSRMCAQADVKLVLSNLSAAEAIPPLAAPLPVSDDHPAYVIFTSGSTGDPKAVVISHRAALNTIADVNSRFGLADVDRVLAVSAMDFDLSVFDIFGLLRAGGSIVLVEEESRGEAVRWIELMRTWNVTVWNSAPALLEMVLIAGAGGALPPSLRLALVSGDWVPMDLRARLVACAPACRLVALGGATEAAIWSNLFEVDEVPPSWRSIPYGRPLANQKFRVVNAWGADCPDWTPGELWIGGAGVALGYRGDPEATNDRFVEHQGERWYRTGDLGCYWPDGVIEFLGRLDGEVKVSGHRIGYGEIEAALNRHGAVAKSVAVAIGEGQTIAAGVVLRDGFDPTVELRPFLETQLPAYMIPKQFVVLDRIPLTANGKVDRAAVARRIGSEPERADDEPPQGAAEEAIAALWAELLKRPRIARNGNFFALGGDSLLATQFVEQARRRLGLQCSLREMLDAPTVRQLAGRVAARHANAAAVEEGVL